MLWSPDRENAWGLRRWVPGLIVTAAAAEDSGISIASDGAQTMSKS
jgi:hypothetical protein